MYGPYPTGRPPRDAPRPENNGRTLVGGGGSARPGAGPRIPPQVRGGTRVADRWRGAESGEVLRAGFPHQGARFHEVFERLLDVLIVDVELIFEGVEFRIVESFPPFAA